MSSLPVAHVIPTWACAMERNLGATGNKSCFYGSRFKEVNPFGEWFFKVCLRQIFDFRPFLPIDTLGFASV